MSYIEREKLLKKVGELESLARERVYDTPTNSPAYQRYSTQMIERASFIDVIKEQPTADVVEVRHGEWGFDGLGWSCSECGEYALSTKTNLQVGSNYCPHCGAKMDGKNTGGKYD